jgi:hypothetical protein
MLANLIKQIIIIAVFAEADFEGITNETSKHYYYDMRSKAGPMGKNWTLSGFAIIEKFHAYPESYSFENYPPNSTNLGYLCLLYATGIKISIERTFDNLVIGQSYRLSFYYGPDEGLEATSFEVSLGNQLVYSTLPTSKNLRQVFTESITAATKSLIVKIAVKGNNKFMRLVGAKLEETGTIMYANLCINSRLFLFLIHNSTQINFIVSL